MTMEWFSWLSKTGLEPSLVYRYGVAFAHNELDRDDLPYFNHEFLQSMGISVAKHRLQILKLARRDAAPNRIRLSRMLIAAVNRLSKHLRAWARRGDPSALALVPIRSCSGRRNSKRSSAAAAAAAASKPNATPLLLTNGSPMVFGSSRINSFASPNFEEGDFEDDRRVVVDDIRWDTMFQDLKPT